MDALPATIDAALEQIERTTGMKAIILIGGPAPATAGDITTHLYESGKSRETDLSFSRSWQGYKGFHEAFVHWLRSVYCKWLFILYFVGTILLMPIKPRMI